MMDCEGIYLTGVLTGVAASLALLLGALCCITPPRHPLELKSLSKPVTPPTINVEQN